MAKKSPYEVLGVPKTATADDIKRARRKKAARSRPDKGGDHDVMAEINHAADILSDPARRLLYDQTGQDSRKPVDDSVRNVILEAFNDALQKDAADCLGHARRDKITVKSGENIFHLLVDHQLQRIEGAISQMDEGAKILDAAMRTLKKYKTTEDFELKTRLIAD